MNRVISLSIPMFVLVACLLAVTGSAQATLIADFNMEQSGSPLVDQVAGYNATESGSGGFVYQQTGVPAGTYGAITLSATLGESAGNTTSHGTQCWQIDSSGSTALNMTNNFTAMAWMYVPSSPAGGYPRTIIGTAGTSWGGWTFGVREGSLGVFFRPEGYSEYDSGTANFTLTLGQWYHFAVTKSSTTGLTFYVDGTSVDNVAAYTGDLTPTDVSATSFTLGHCKQNATWGLYGALLDEVRVYNTVLTASEIVSAAETPEPGTLALIITGLLALLAYAWRKRK